MLIQLPEMKETDSDEAPRVLVHLRKGTKSLRGNVSVMRIVEWVEVESEVKG
jgi:hypothetical protein